MPFFSELYSALVNPTKKLKDSNADLGASFLLDQTDGNECCYKLDPEFLETMKNIDLSRLIKSNVIQKGLSVLTTKFQKN
jgi:hypothetical protein